MEGAAHEETVSLLINERNKKGQTPLHVACKYGNLEAVKILLEEAGIEIMSHDSKGKTPLHYLCSKNHSKIIDVLTVKYFDSLAENPNRDVLYIKEINSADRTGESPIQKACEKGHSDTVDTMLGLKCIDLGYGDNEGKTPIQVAKNKVLTVIDKHLKSGIYPEPRLYRDKELMTSFRTREEARRASRNIEGEQPLI